MDKHYPCHFTSWSINTSGEKGSMKIPDKMKLNNGRVKCNPDILFESHNPGKSFFLMFAKEYGKIGKQSFSPTDLQSLSLLSIVFFLLSWIYIFWSFSSKYLTQLSYLHVQKEIRWIRKDGRWPFSFHLTSLTHMHTFFLRRSKLILDCVYIFFWFVSKKNTSRKKINILKRSKERAQAHLYYYYFLRHQNKKRLERFPPGRMKKKVSLVQDPSSSHHISMSRHQHYILGREKGILFT